MQLRIQILAIESSLAMLLLVILRLISQRRLREESSLLWSLAASSLLGLSIFGGVVGAVARFVGVGHAPYPSEERLEADGGQERLSQP